MLAKRMSLVFFLGVVVCRWVGHADATRLPRYFPETGKGAIHQHALDLSNGTVVLAIVLQPGYEDFPLLANLRTAVGAHVVVAYLTNGEAAPDDTGEATPEMIAGARKEEAFAAMRQLNVTVHFLNLRDPGVVNSRQALEEIWGVDTTLSRLRETILYAHPDVVLIGGDLRADTVQSMRQRFLTELVLTLTGTSGEIGRAQNGPVSDPFWRGIRVYVESERGRRVTREDAYDRLHPVWKKTSRAIASEAVKEYHSLRLQLGSWMRRGDRRYVPARPDGTGPLQTMVAGLHDLSPPLRTLGNAIRKLATRSNHGVREPLLKDVARAIDTLDVHLAHGRGSIEARELRLLAAWKNDLESLRCSLLDIGVTYAASDSLVAASQLFHLKFEALSSRSPQGATKIYFPGAMDHTWGINESVEYQFPFHPPQQFEILTPQQLEYTFPVTPAGIRQSSLRTRFAFILAHNDPVHQYRYLYRGEILLRAGPRRIFEILTPIVRAADNQPIIFRLTNVTRDPFKSTVTVRDTIVNAVSKNVHLPGKDAVLVDTLLLSPRGPLPGGDYPLVVSLPGVGEKSIVARSFEAQVDSQARVALLTDFEASPVAHALDRLGVLWRRIDAPTIERSVLSQSNVIILDRDVLAELQGRNTQIQAILAWVRAGGHLLVLPQDDVAEGGVWFIPGASFRRSPHLPPNTAVRIDSVFGLLRSPNALSSGDWDGWMVARSLCSVDVGKDRLAHVMVSSVDRNVPLLVTLPEGKGRITLVALNLISQLVNVHSGVHRILANLLKP